MKSLKFATCLLLLFLLAKVAPLQISLKKTIYPDFKDSYVRLAESIFSGPRSIY